MDLLLRFIKQGAGKEPCQRDSKATEVRAVQHTQLRYCEREYLSTKQKKYPPHGKWKTMAEIERYSSRFNAFLPLIDT